jgi:iron complex transport system substrate-binding protein
LVLLFVGCVAIVAIVLRVRSQWERATASDAGSAADATSRPVASGPALQAAMPRDYVVEPMVVPEEATAGPRRIVSLAPSVTEIVCALGLRDRLVGRTHYCTWPPGIEKVQAVGVLSEANYGLIKSLDPDLVLSTTNSGDVPENLGKLGLRCETVEHEGIAQVYTAIERIGQLCDRPRTAFALASAIRGDMERLQQAAAKAACSPKRVLVLFGELPVPPRSVFAAGPGLFLDELVQLAGHRNAAREVLKSSEGEIPLERFRMLDPEIILEFRDHPDGQATADMYRAWAQVGDLRVIRERQVRTVGGREWLSCGPRIALELHRFMTVLSDGG